jgi:hypothetical protein
MPNSFHTVMKEYGARFEVFTAMRIHVMVIWVVMMYSGVVGNQCFIGHCCLHLHYILTMEAPRSSETLLSYHIITQHHNPEDHDLKRMC